jgi:hypothetical protein
MTRPMPLKPPEPHNAVGAASDFIFALEVLAICAAIAIFAGIIAILP